MAKFNPKARHQARFYALQALYEWQISQNDLSFIEDRVKTDNDLSDTDIEYFKELLHQIPDKLDSIDDLINMFLDRPFSELNPIELSVMRIGTYELAVRTEIPYRVVINEALVLAKTFGAAEGHKYVNGILDKIAHQVRADEIAKR